MKHILIPLLGLLAWASRAGQCPAQTLERQVVGAAGSAVQTAAGALEFTVGEMAISARPTANLYWGEGFQQVWVAPVVSTDDPAAPVSIALRVYPNPARQYVQAESNMPHWQAQLFDLTGRPVSARLVAGGTVRFDMEHLPAGFYLLRALDEQGRTAGVAKVQHVAD